MITAKVVLHIVLDDGTEKEKELGIETWTGRGDQPILKISLGNEKVVLRNDATLNLTWVLTEKADGVYDEEK